jgi:hypothetical protein
MKLERREEEENSSSSSAGRKKRRGDFEGEIPCSILLCILIYLFICFILVLPYNVKL